ncbi:MAG: sialate O-acetylesterase [Verrucomicrobiales bacterium]
MKKPIFCVGSVLVPVFLLIPCSAGAEAVKVFLLAGQSNMEGKAPNELLEHQAVAEGTKEHFEAYRKEGKWLVRDDVWIKFLDRKGGLTLGFGSPGRTGVELAFGTAMGDRFEEPVILVKAAWGGHALAKQFRSPSAGFPEEVIEKEWKQAKERVAADNAKNNQDAPLPTLDDIRKEYGASYREMLSEVRQVMSDPGAVFPELAGRTAELAGLVWFQGWNDQYGSENEYASNMKHFIHDVRRELRAPVLPIVIAAMGQNGSKPSEGAMRIVQEAQLSMNDVPEFKGTVKAIRTDTLVDTAAESLYPKWKENFEEWKLVGGDHPYHYLGSAIWFTRIGCAMADAMQEMIADSPAGKEK